MQLTTKSIFFLFKKPDSIDWSNLMQSRRIDGTRLAAETKRGPLIITYDNRLFFLKKTKIYSII